MGVKGTGGQEEDNENFLGPEGNGPPVESCIEGGVDVMVTEAGRERESPLKGRTPRSLQRPGLRSREAKGGLD